MDTRLSSIHCWSSSFRLGCISLLKQTQNSQFFSPTASGLDGSESQEFRCRTGWKFWGCTPYSKETFLFSSSPVFFCKYNCYLAIRLLDQTNCTAYTIIVLFCSMWMIQDAVNSYILFAGQLWKRQFILFSLRFLKSICFISCLLTGIKHFWKEKLLSIAADDADWKRRWW